MIHHPPQRTPQHPIHPLILRRWSPRAMTGEPLSNEELCSLFEAARWAPSSFNEQPWRFLYALRGSSGFQRLFSLLVPFNQAWTAQAAILGIITSRSTFAKTGKPSPSHALDTGAAWENVCLEGAHRGLVVHGMSGFDYAKAKEEFQIQDPYTIQAMFAIGKQASLETLSTELQSREFPSTERKTISEITVLIN